MWRLEIPARNAAEVNPRRASSCGKLVQMQVDQVNNIVVLDIGSRGGLHRCWHHFAFPIELYFFEPEPEGFEVLSNACAAEGVSGNVYHVMNAAVDSGTGERTLNIYSNRAASSFFEHVPGGCYRFENFVLERKVPVPTISISDLVDREGVKPKFMTIDVEGAELDVLRGGEAVLASMVLGLRCEVGLSDIYSGAPEFDQVLAYLRGIGFRLARVETCNAGLYGLTTDMNKYSVSPMDAMPLAADFIFVNRRLIDGLIRINAAPQAVTDLFNAVLFCIHNGCGYLGMDFLERMVAKGLWDTYQATWPARADVFASHVAAYFAVPRKNSNKVFDPVAIFGELLRGDFATALDAASAGARDKISTIYNDDLLFSRLMAPDGQYDTVNDL